MTLFQSEEQRVTKVRTDKETIREMFDPGSQSDIISVIKEVGYVDLLMERSSNDLRLFVLYAWKSIFLCKLYLLIISQITQEQTLNNKTFHSLHSNILNAMQQHCVDPVYTISTITVGMYKQGRYKDVVKSVDKIRTKLQNLHIMYTWILDEDKYIAAGGENTPLITMMRKTLTQPFWLDTNTGFIELALEHQESVKQIGNDLLVFPPLIIANFILFLLNYHMQYHDKAEEALRDLFAVVHYDDDYHIQEILKAISWEILGICQEMMGDYHGSYQSYTTALQQQHNWFRSATVMRLLIILYKSLCLS